MSIRRPIYSQKKMFYQSMQHHVYSENHVQEILVGLEGPRLTSPDVNYNVDWWLRMVRHVEVGLVSVPASYPLNLTRALESIHREHPDLSLGVELVRALQPIRVVNGVQLRALIRAYLLRGSQT